MVVPVIVVVVTFAAVAVVVVVVTVVALAVALAVVTFVAVAVIVAVVVSVLMTRRVGILATMRRSGRSRGVGVLMAGVHVWLTSQECCRRAGT